jgi:nuclear RNA export factor
LFPTLKLLDGEELLDEIEFGVEETKKLPASVKTGFSDSEISLTTAQGFLGAFFEHFDGNRSLLGNFYDANSCFSLSISNNPSNSKLDRNAYENLFKSWLPKSRNLIRVKQADKRFSTLQIGVENIINTFNQLPATKHPLEEPPEKRRFVFDTYQQGSGPTVYLYVYLHGEFALAGNPNSKRSFDRTFVLVPAVPGSRASMAGLPVTIINDSMTIRTYSNNYAWAKAVDLNSISSANGTMNLNQLPHYSVLQKLQAEQGLVRYTNSGRSTTLSGRSVCSSNWIELCVQCTMSARNRLVGTTSDGGI